MSGNLLSGALEQSESKSPLRPHFYIINSHGFGTLFVVEGNQHFIINILGKQGMKGPTSHFCSSMFPSFSVFLNNVIFVAKMALVMLVITNLHFLTAILFRDLFNKRLHTLIVINKISVVCLAIDHSASGVVIKINIVFEFVILLPNLVVTARIVQKITVGFPFIQRAAMK